MRRKIPIETWEQVKTAFAVGIGLREIARSMNIPAGTILSRAKRERWTREIQSAKALAKRQDALTRGGTRRFRGMTSSAGPTRAQKEACLTIQRSTRSLAAPHAINQNRLAFLLVL
jgi:hypothetical protein